MSNSDVKASKPRGRPGTAVPKYVVATIPDRALDLEYMPMAGVDLAVKFAAQIFIIKDSQTRRR
jgi:hypothetical protein